MPKSVPKYPRRRMEHMVSHDDGFVQVLCEYAVPFSAHKAAGPQCLLFLSPPLPGCSRFEVQGNPEDDVDRKF